MSTQALQAMERDEMLRLRREGGLWLRGLRERAGLSQRELATAIGADYYSFISQLESGKGRVPVSQVELWAKALKVRRSDFARGVLRYYDPVTYAMLFEDEAEQAQEPHVGARPSELDTADEQQTPVAPVQRGVNSSQRSALPGRGPRTASTAPDSDEDLRARIDRLEAILLMRGARP